MSVSVYTEEEREEEEAEITEYEGKHNNETRHDLKPCRDRFFYRFYQGSESDTNSVNSYQLH